MELLGIMLETRLTIYRDSFLDELTTTIAHWISIPALALKKFYRMSYCRGRFVCKITDKRVPNIISSGSIYPRPVS